MKKLVLRTTLITIGALAVLSLLVCGALFLFFPKSVANFFYNAGNYDLGIKYYEKQYDKSNSAEDLYNLCVKLDNAKDSVKVEKYSSKLIVMQDFANFCASKDSEANAITTEEFIEGKYVVAIQLNGNNIDNTLKKAQDLVENGYTEYNPFYMLYTESLLELTPTDLYKIRDKISLLEFANKIDSTGKQFANADVIAINQLLDVE